jgi:hypothetical protein
VENLDRESVAVVCFWAGEARFALSAALVARILEPREGAPLLAALLRVPAGAAATPRWSLHLRHGADTAELIVEGPIQFDRVNRAALLPAPRVLPVNRLVLGHARAAERVITLLDGVALLAAAQGASAVSVEGVA